VRKLKKQALLEQLPEADPLGMAFAIALQRRWRFRSFQAPVTG
jgi:hypothetical protein